jgi:hypothetical protein
VHRKVHDRKRALSLEGQELVFSDSDIVCELVPGDDEVWSVGDRECAMKIEMINGEPGRHTGRARHVSLFAVKATRALSRVKHRVRIVEPPRRPAQPLEGLGRFVVRQRISKRTPGRVPAALGERCPSSRAPHAGTPRRSAFRS